MTLFLSFSCRLNRVHQKEQNYTKTDLKCIHLFCNLSQARSRCRGTGRCMAILTSAKKNTIHQTHSSICPKKQMQGQWNCFASTKILVCDRVQFGIVVNDARKLSFDFHPVVRSTSLKTESAFLSKWRVFNKSFHLKLRQCFKNCSHSSNCCSWQQWIGNLFCSTAFPKTSIPNNQLVNHSSQSSVTITKYCHWRWN